MYPLKAINNTFKTFAQNHAQINSYGYGDTFNMTAERLLYNATESNLSLAYPILWVMPAASVMERRMFKVNFKILFGDILLDDYSNVDNVLSDTALTLGDLMAYLTQTLNNTPEAGSIAPDYTFNATPFIDDAQGMFPDKIAGWKLDITLNIINTHNVCEIPYV